MTQELAPYYTDPLHDKLDAVEDSVEFWRDPQTSRPLPDAEEMDDLCKMTGLLEASIEWTTVPPLRPWGDVGPPPVMPGPPPAIIYGSFNTQPPVPDDSWAGPLNSIDAPLAATPYFTHEGLSNRPYHPMLGGRTGVRGETAAAIRWCPEHREAVEETACFTCDCWADRGAGYAQCRYDWEEEKQEHEEGEEET